MRCAIFAAVLLAVCTCGAMPPAQSATLQDSQGWLRHYALLSNNTYYDGPALKTGATYSFDPAFDGDVIGDAYRGTPGEPAHRLTDGGVPWNDWNACLVFRRPGQQAVIFDLRSGYIVGGVRIEAHAKASDSPQKVVVLTSASKDGPWIELGSSGFDERWTELVAAKPVVARYVKLDFTVSTSTVCELQVFGGPMEPKQLAKAPGYLVKDGKAAAVIAVPRNPSVNVARGARELQRVIHRSTGAWLPVCYESEVGKRPAVYIGLTKAAAKRGIRVRQTYPSGEGYRMVTSGSDIFLLGNDNVFTGSEYACYDFLQRVTGVRWLYPGDLGEVLEPRRSLKMPKLAAYVKPQIMFRKPGMYSESIEATVPIARWFSHNRLDGAPMPLGHTIAAGVPANKYATDHPEYYPLVGGERRTSGGNPCTSNPDVIRLTAEAVMNVYASDPRSVGFSLMQEDGTPFCGCEKCAALDGPTVGNWYHDKGPRLLHFTNAVSKIVRQKYLDKFLFTSAYWHSLTAPKEVKGEKGVRALVVFAGCLGHAIDDPKCPTNVLYKQIVEQWAKIAGPIGIYDYSIPQNWKQMMRPQLDMQLRNMRLYKRVGTCGYYIESWPSFGPYGPIYWAAARSGWDDPDKLTRDGLWSEWCSQYGPASKQMQAFYRVLEDAIANSKAHHGMGLSWNMPDPVAGIYTEDVLKKAEVKFAAAEKAVKNGSAVHKLRLARERKLWDYTKAGTAFLAASGETVKPEDQAAQNEKLAALSKDAHDRCVVLTNEGIISAAACRVFSGGF